jgi:chromosome segregation ATPase
MLVKMEHNDQLSNTQEAHQTQMKVLQKSLSQCTEDHTSAMNSLKMSKDAEITELKKCIQFSRVVTLFFMPRNFLNKFLKESEKKLSILQSQIDTLRKDEEAACAALKQIEGDFSKFIQEKATKEHKLTTTHEVRMSFTNIYKLIPFSNYVF